MKGRKQVKKGLGLHIGQYSSVLVELHEHHGQLKIHRYARAEHPERILPDNDQDARMLIAERLQKAAGAHGWKGRKTVALLDNRFVYSRLILLPQMPENEIKPALCFETGQYMGVDVDELVLEYIPVTIPGPAGRQPFFVIASRRDAVDILTGICRSAGLKLQAIEIEPLALLRLLGPRAWEGTAGLLTFRTGNCSFTVFHDGIPLYSRSVTLLAAEGTEAAKQGDMDMETGTGIQLSGSDSVDQAIKHLLEEAMRNLNGVFPRRIMAVGSYFREERNVERLKNIFPIEFQAVDRGDYFMVQDTGLLDAKGRFIIDLLLATAAASRGLLP